MQLRNFFQQTVPIVVVIVLLTGANAACSYLLSKRDQNLIHIAFMNGAARMLELDMKDIEKLKSNRALSKKVVTIAANRYLKKVEMLNLPETRLASTEAASKYKIGRTP